MKRVLVDTGPLVAIMSRTDQHHKVCVETLQDLPGPLFSCWPVITEAAWLLRGHRGAVPRLLGSISEGFLELLPIQSAEAAEIGKMMGKYRNIRPQLADAALVYLAERDGFDVIFTLDQRDFSVYQAGRKRAFRIIPEC
ncbi:MAG TPA: PIN domain-containing protein [Terriglobales bacterium]|nr:PIN domain-containing protein [Terriglobales bacterium]